MVSFSCENLSRLVTSPDLLSHLQALKLDGGEKNVSFQWLGPHFLAFLEYAKKWLNRFRTGQFSMDLRDLLKRLDDSASDCISYGETEHYKKFLEIIVTLMPRLNEFFPIIGPISSNFFVSYKWEIFIDYLFDSIQELVSCNNDSSVLVSNQVKSLQKGLNFLLAFVVYPFPSDVKEQETSIFTEIEVVLYEAGLFLHSFFLTTDLVTSTRMDLAIFVLLEKIEIVLVKIKYYSIAVSSEVGIGSLQVAESPSEVGIESLQVAESPSKVSSSQDKSIPMVEEIIVGLEDRTTQIVGKLIGEPSRRQIFSIVGMGGLGKTTLAKKIYNDPNVRYHFHKLSWCAVSQTYNKTKLLKDILSSLAKKDDISKMKDEELPEGVYKNLKGRRYLIIMDDLWDKEVWDDLKMLFPDDTNGSRVLFTSRQKNVASEISHVIIEPPPLSPSESWNLLEQKVFKKERCPRELQDIGKQIAANCKGLPLLVVLIAGILSNMVKASSWQQVAKSLSDYIFQKADDYIPTLELSYIHLPKHLKPCFLHLSTFQEDEKIPVRKLLFLWIAEGLVEKKEHKSLEDVAEEYLMELIDRSLLQVVKRRTDNGVKACNLHDLVLDMCSKMVEEDENLLLQYQFLVSKYRHLHRLSMSQFHHVWMSENIYEAFSIVYNLKKITILDSSNFNNVRWEIKRMSDSRYLDLRYLEISRLVRWVIKMMPDLRYLNLSDWEISRLEPSIGGKLHNLEYLFLYSVNDLPTYILNMPKLRHLRVNDDFFGAKFAKNSDSLQINCLQNLGYVQIADSEDAKILRCSPNLRTLKFQSIDNYFPDINFLSQLQTLAISGDDLHDFSRVKFPMNIKKLTLSDIGLPWEKMSLIGTLPNLEILKLKSNACIGKIWYTKDGEFENLKFLELESQSLDQWNSSNDHFPILERLLLRDCKDFKIPFEFSYISTLQEIKVLNCKDAETSALEIHKEQLNYGNREFYVIIRSY